MVVLSSSGITVMLALQITYAHIVRESLTRTLLFRALSANGLNCRHSYFRRLFYFLSLFALSIDESRLHVRLIRK